MKTSLIEEFRHTDYGKVAESIIQKCVHCGFCNANCPTYRLTGDELDGPRGRIYQIKTLLETNQVSSETQLHLDRCLTCRRCETTCPSSVEYGQLLDIGRHIVEKKRSRAWHQQLLRKLILYTLPNAKRLATPLAIGKTLRPILPNALKKTIPRREAKINSILRAPINPNGKTVLLPRGCVQSITKPNTVTATQQLLFKLGYGVRILGDECCGALAYHLNEEEAALSTISKNINRWYEELKRADYLLITASGCGSMVQNYAHVTGLDPTIQKKLDRVHQCTKDLCEIIQPEELKKATDQSNPLQKRVVFHPPCTLAHGMKLGGKVEQLLEAAGIHLTPFAESDQCCGSAGAYSILQPQFSKAIKHKKVTNLLAAKPDVILTSNIGCQLYIEGDVKPPVLHWAELVNERINPFPPATVSPTTFRHSERKQEFKKFTQTSLTRYVDEAVHWRYLLPEIMQGSRGCWRCLPNGGQRTHSHAGAWERGMSFLNRLNTFDRLSLIFLSTPSPHSRQTQHSH